MWLFFPDISLQQSLWQQLDLESGRIIEQGEASLKPDAAAFANNVDRSIIIVPQSLCTLTTAEIEEKTHRQYESAIGFALEDQLAQDIEDCFFATAATSDSSSTPVAIIDRGWLSECLDLFKAKGINGTEVVAEIYLLPPPGKNQISCQRSRIQPGYLVRTGVHQGFYVEPSMLALSLNHLQQNNPELTHCATNDDFVIHALAQTPLESTGLAEAKTGFDPKTMINFRQKDFQLFSEWSKTFNFWRQPLYLTGLLILAFLGYQVADYRSLQSDLSAEIAQQNQILKSINRQWGTTENPKKEFTDRLISQTGSNNRLGLVEPLHQVSRVLQKNPQLQLTRVLFQNQKLILSVEAKELKTMEKVETELKQSDYKVSTENLNVSPDKTTARLIMESS